MLSSFGLGLYNPNEIFSKKKNNEWSKEGFEMEK